MPLGFGTGTGSGFASPGLSLDLSTGFSVLVPVGSVGSSPALVAATFGLTELSLEGSAAFGAFGRSEADGVGSGDELPTTRLARDLLAADEELNGCWDSFFLELS
jgi:hypothetical protein